MGSVTNLKTNKTLFISCECKSEVLVIEYDHEIKLADCAIFRYKYPSRMSLWQKFRHIYQIFFYSTPYLDEIVLGSSSLKDLKVFLSSLDL